MKVFVLNPSYGSDFCRSARWACKSRGRVQRHPDWLLVAVAVLENSGSEVRFVDGAARNLGREEIKKILVDFNPELAVIHTTTPSIYSDISYAKLSKETCGCKTVLVGPHVTTLPGETLHASGGAVDIIARGEYDYILRDIASGKKLENIEGITYLSRGEAVNNPPRAPIDVNELPFPSWKHIKPEWYRDAGKRFPFLTLISGRGCNGRCTFCRDTQVMCGRPARFRKSELVVDEMEYDMKEFPYIREIMFETDTFTASSGHVRGVCEEIIRRGLKITWSCNVRVDMDLSLLPLMKRSGCRMLMIGYEFGTQEALDSVRKDITPEQSIKFSEAAAKLGFTLHGCFMIGAPGETSESAEKTIDFAKSLPLDTIQVTGICVYPGTELYSWAKGKGYLIPKDWNEWVSPGMEQVTLLNYPQLSKREIDRYIDAGLAGFYLRPKQIIRMLMNIGSYKDIGRIIFGFGSFLDYFLQKIAACVRQKCRK